MRSKAHRLVSPQETIHYRLETHSTRMRGEVLEAKKREKTGQRKDGKGKF